MENKNHKQAVLYCRLKKSLPEKQKFKQDLLEQDWVEPYLRSNLEQLSHV